MDEWKKPSTGGIVADDSGTLYIVTQTSRIPRKDGDGNIIHSYEVGVKRYTGSIQYVRQGIVSDIFKADELHPTGLRIRVK